ncbi:SPOR domain-containing protein, partial [Anaeromyxobacter oryzisoli]|uniref:SPOR domain-containing protein n=1 Tax=Anaeromyxobacter oryzisoli TaxID=2925408 RepID=UPI001F59996A
PPPERERDTATAVQGAAPARPATSARAAAPASRSGASGGAFTVQLAAATSRGDAERLASRYASIGARVESADVAGKGRVYRVRAGRFPDRASAERYLKDVVRETGAKGFVAENR